MAWMLRNAALIWFALCAASSFAQAQTTPAATGQFRSPVDPPLVPTPVGSASIATATTTPVDLPPRKSPATMPLAPGREPRTNPLSGNVPPLVTALGSLAVVLSLFFALAWVLRRSNPKSAALLPQDVVELLGRAPLPGRQQMQLIRCGNKLLLVCLSQAGAETLTEITDPQEVDRLAGLCRQAQPHSATATFQQIFQQLGQSPPPPLEFSEPGHDRRVRTTAARGKRIVREDDDV
jgi:flagellar biogenesis protein FliO